jgi:apolipoprotein N-acyltransferase
MTARIAAILVGGGLHALACPPVDGAAFAWLTLVPLLLAIRGRGAAAALAYGTLYGSAVGWSMTWWAAEAAARFFGLGLPLAILALTAFYALVSAPTFGLFAAGAQALLRHRSSAAARLAVAALWVATELVRARVVGQPWGLLGYTQHAHLGLIQMATVTGVYGVSFVLVLGNALVADAVLALRRGAGRRLARLAPPALLIVAPWIGGAILTTRAAPETAPARPVVVVQTGVPPAFEWTRAYAEQQLLAHLRATRAALADTDAALVVWPEHAVTRYLEREPWLAAELATLAARHRTDLLFGVPRFEAERTYNSVRLITAAGRNGGHYDKQHLVLFAEATPYVDPRASGPSESPRAFSAGSGPGVLQGFLPLGVSICHEVLDPDLIGRAVRAGAAVLVNVSNDGWLDGGHGVASRQHFAMATFRSVEARRYLVRAATTGISGVIDPYGRVLRALPPGTTGTAVAAVAGRTDLTPYVRYGDAFALACALAAAAALGAPRLRAARRGRPLTPATADTALA